jgi:hypothetical protein
MGQALLESIPAQAGAGMIFLEEPISLRRDIFCDFWEY